MDDPKIQISIAPEKASEVYGGGGGRPDAGMGWRQFVEN
jgi:hypothetical protein